MAGLRSPSDVPVAAAAALAEVRARPLHAALAVFVVGLLAGPRAPILVPAALAACPLLGRRPAVALALAAALLGGAVLANARLAALDREFLAHPNARPGDPAARAHE